MPLAAIIVVGVGVLALTISRVASQSSSASVLEGVSMQAFYAAESGAHYGMHQLMFDVVSRTVADQNCNDLTTDTSLLTFTVAGLDGCTADVSCVIDTVAGSPQSFYRIRSSAACGAGNLFSQRVIEVSSFL